MTYSIPSHSNPNDTFWLARHTHNVLAPLIEGARQYEPSIMFKLILHFDVEQSYRSAGSHLEINAHWNRVGMFIFVNDITTSEDVAKVAAKVQAFIDAEQVKLEVEHDAKVQYAAKLERLRAEDAMRAEADAAADQDFDAQQDRIRERADIERDEHDHDIELQNEMAGN